MFKYGNLEAKYTALGALCNLSMIMPIIICATDDARICPV